MADSRAMATVSPTPRAPHTAGTAASTPEATVTSPGTTGPADARPADATTPSGPGFTAQVVSTHVTRIQDPHGVLMYLVTGRDRALLVDTGYGVGDLAAFVTGLTDQPVTVILTHAHVDHAFGASQFQDVHLNRTDLPVLTEHQALSSQLHAEVAASATPTPFLAPAVDPAQLAPLEPGERIDLGEAAVRAFAAPGHTPGSLALLVEPDRLLITGDAANQFTFLFLPESSSVAEYAATLHRLRAETAGTFDRVLVSHGSGEITPTVLDELIALCERVLSGTDDAVPLTFQGKQGLVARAVAPGAGNPHPDAPDGPLIDDAPNLVYSPDRIR